MKTLSLPFLAAFAIFSSFTGRAADLTLNPLFTDHAVLQQEMPVPVWGSAKPGKKVTVIFRKAEKSGQSVGFGSLDGSS